MRVLHVQFLILMFAGWVNRSQQNVIDYLQAENRVLRDQLSGRRILFTDWTCLAFRTPRTLKIRRLQTPAD